MKQRLLQALDIKSQYLPSLIADKLQGLIVNQEFHVGERLPSERELAAMLGVSRNVVREATKLLQERGLVAVQSGSGVYVTAMAPSVVSKSVSLYVLQQQVSIAQVNEIRWLLEIETTRLAAIRATEADIAELEACIQKSQRYIHQPALFTPSDIEFHMRLAQASQNPILPLLLETITDALQAQCHLTEQLHGAQENALKHHVRIFDAIKARDITLACRAMQEHLESTGEWLLQAIENPPHEIDHPSAPA